MPDDQQLLRRYVADGSETAFAELVARHVNLVYSVALRRTGGDEQLTKDVAQQVFTDLARKARSLPENVVLAGWLHRATRYAAAQLLRTERRRAEREQEAVTMNALESEPASDWEQIRPLLDQALDELGADDRDALILRFFEQRSLAEVGNVLGSNEDAARKRVTRALEKLRADLVRRGVTTTAAALSATITVNAMQVAPVGLAAALSTTAIAGTILTAAVVTATKTIAMTTLQKTLITTTIIAAVGAGLYETRQAANARAQVETLQQQQATWTKQIQQLTRERDDGTRLLAAQREEIDRSNRTITELPKLRGEVAQLRRDKNEAASQKPEEKALDTSDPKWKPNWNILTPFDLAQFPDSETNINDAAAMDAGTATPAALLQTWIWAQRTGNTAGILRTRSFPEGTTEEKKLEWVEEVQRIAEYDRQNPQTVGHSVRTRLRDLYSLGNDRYLALIEGKGLTTETWISHQFFSRVGDEWRVGDK